MRANSDSLRAILTNVRCVCRLASGPCYQQASTRVCTHTNTVHHRASCQACNCSLVQSMTHADMHVALHVFIAVNPVTEPLLVGSGSDYQSFGKVQVTRFLLQVGLLAYGTCASVPCKANTIVTQACTCSLQTGRAPASMLNRSLWTFQACDVQTDHRNCSRSVWPTKEVHHVLDFLVKQARGLDLLWKGTLSPSLVCSKQFGHSMVSFWALPAALASPCPLVLEPRLLVVGLLCLQAFQVIRPSWCKI